jgi:hypothetical protein
MTSKLTLSIDKIVVEEAKKFVIEKNISLSKLIENYLVRLTQDNDEKTKHITPLVKSLSGILKLDKL